jgi:hypothetical protein
MEVINLGTEDVLEDLRDFAITDFKIFLRECNDNETGSGLVE